jgi:hypothetical protein
LPGAANLLIGSFMAPSSVLRAAEGRCPGAAWRPVPWINGEGRRPVTPIPFLLPPLLFDAERRLLTARPAARATPAETAGGPRTSMVVPIHPLSKWLHEGTSNKKNRLWLVWLALNPLTSTVAERTIEAGPLRKRTSNR